jgi:hypothetical protein
MKREFYRQIFEKCSNIKFHETPPSGSPVVDGQTGGQTDGWTDMTMLRVAFRSFEHAPKMERINLYNTGDMERKQN